MRREAAILGGDQRQVYLGQILSSRGWEIVTWGLEKGGGVEAVPLHRAIEYPSLVFPLPMCRGSKLNLPLTDSSLEGKNLWPQLRAEQLLLGGMTGDLPRQLYRDYGLTLLDYYRREELQIANAALTAEGAVQRAMEETAHALQKSRCLVLGFGRIGKLLAHRLAALGCDVWVWARKVSDRAWAQAYGYHAPVSGELLATLGEFDIIFNTVPALLLTAEHLRRVRPRTLMVELASAPGGIDRGAAAVLQRRLVQAPGLPGAVAPESAAAAIADSLEHILEERGDPA